MNTKNIKSITLVFENCETVNVDMKDIEYIGFENVQDFKIGENLYNKCDKFEIEFKKSAESIKTSIFSICSNWDEDLFERIQTYTDITWVILDDEYDKEKMIYVPWEDNNICENLLQKSWTTEDGGLRVEVNKVGQH